MNERRRTHLTIFIGSCKRTRPASRAAADFPGRNYDIMGWARWRGVRRPNGMRPRIMTMRIEADGARRRLSPDEFRQELGVEYAPGLIGDDGWPVNCAVAADECNATTERALGAAATAVLRAALAGAADLPVCVADAGPGVGRGLFAAQVLLPGAFIGEYAGVLSRDWTPVARGGRFNPYLLKYPFDCPFAIDAAARGNELRFANHSARAPNARRLFLEHGGLLRALIVASAPIAAGAQILLDYGPDYRFAAPPRELAP